MTDVVVVREWFPAIADLPSGERLAVAKVYLTENDTGQLEVHVYVAVERVPTLALRAVVLDKSLAAPYAPQSQPSTVNYDAGTLTIFRTSGCGCSHPLKRFRPFGRYGRVAR